jgi:acetylornithine deacetylase/succinyl-diaminopimelate desuccinylase-like protein
VQADLAAEILEQLFTKNPPSGARIEVDFRDPMNGWHAPPLADWLALALDDASFKYFGKPACHQGEGGSIPFMGMLHRQFPTAQFVVTGVLGPGSNAHGPNEFLHVPYAKRLTSCIVDVLNSIPTY